jgi:alpha-aminoadipate carrier protein LysW
MSLCPVCEGEVEIAEDVEESEIVECIECGTELEVLSLNPTRLVEAPEEDEDWGE